MPLKRIEDLTPEQRAAADAILARNRTPERRAELARIRADVMREFPPLTISAGLAESLASLRLERERLGLSLSDVQARSGLDRGMISRLENGKIANPTASTLESYAAALGRRMIWATEPAEAGD
ncbi:helix-turn-helix domain-containing protein [Isosphaeraceae bacterium EP7]